MKELNGQIGNNDFTDGVKEYYKTLRRSSKPLTREEEKVLIKAAKNGDKEARNRIILANLRFVFDQAKKYRGKGVDMDELIAHGNAGLIKALDKFDDSKDFKFISYAVWWIRQKMLKAIEEYQKKNVVITSYYDTIAYDGSKNECDCDDADDDNTDGYESYSDSDDYEKREEEELKQTILYQVIDKLPEREQVIIKMFYGIGEEEKEYTIEQIAKMVNLSNERVRQLKLRAINSMRQQMFMKKEAAFMF